jgi:anti-sigma B factor antagonist
MGIAVNTRAVSGITIFDLSGRLVAGPEGDTLCEALRQSYELGNRLILLNCAGLTYVDSCGIGDLVAAYAAILRRGGVMGCAILFCLRALAKIATAGGD